MILKKIIIIESQPLTLMTKKNFHLDTLGKVVEKFEYWDITKIYTQTYPYCEKLEFKNIKKFESFVEFKTAVNKENSKNTILIVQVSIMFSSIKIYRLLKINNFIIYFFQTGTMPTGHIPTIVRLANPWPFLVNKFLNKYILILLLKLSYIKNYDYVFAAGQKSIDMHKVRSKIIPINLVEYDECLENRNQLRTFDSKYCVFLDQSLPNHPDYSVLNQERISDRNYYCLLNKFFEIIENKLHLDVIIAAHPKSNYKNNPFNNRRIIKYKTRQLVANCEVVIAFTSISICNAIIYNKPLLFYYTEEIKKIKKADYYFVYNISLMLESPLINIDKINKEEIYIPIVNGENYKKYKYDYITTVESQKIITNDIIVNHFNIYSRD